MRVEIIQVHYAVEIGIVRVECSYGIFFNNHFCGCCISIFAVNDDVSYYFPEDFVSQIHTWVCTCELAGT